MQQMKRRIAVSARPQRFNACEIGDDGAFSKEAQLLEARWAVRHGTALGPCRGSSISRGRTVVDDKSVADDKRASSRFESSRSTTPPQSNNSDANTLVSDDGTPLVDEARLRAHIFSFGPRERIEAPQKVRRAPKTYSDVSGYWQELQASLDAMGAATQKISTTWSADPGNEICSQEPELEPSFHLRATCQAGAA